MNTQQEPTNWSRDAQFAVKETTKDAVEATRLAVMHGAMESADRVRILAELGIEES